jgi:hypothetical protein
MTTPEKKNYFAEGNAAMAAWIALPREQRSAENHPDNPYAYGTTEHRQWETGADDFMAFYESAD